jgi:hypothetical protein
MNEHYQGHGVLYDDRGQPLASVDYDFQLDSERGAIGSLHCVQRDLPALSVLRLRLDDPMRYLDVRLVLRGPSPDRKRCEYALDVPPDQLNDLYNVVTFHRAQQSVHIAAAA